MALPKYVTGNARIAREKIAAALAALDALPTNVALGEEPTMDARLARAILGQEEDARTVIRRSLEEARNAIWYKE